MKDPIFVKVRNDQGEIYHSYDIYWQLVELSKFPSCELAEVNPDADQTYIFTPNNGNVAECCQRPHKAKYILWNLEIPGQVEALCPDYFDEMWVSCQYFYSLIPKRGKFVVLGGHIGLYTPDEQEKKWDFCHFSYLYGKRAEQVSQLEAQGYSMAPLGWGSARDDVIAQSRWGLCLHQNPVPALSPQRMTLFACQKLPIILEEANSFPYQVVKLKDFHREIKTDQLVERNFRFFTELETFRAAVEAAL